MRFRCRVVLAMLGGLALAIAARPIAAQVIRGVIVDDGNLAPVSTATVQLVDGEELTVGTETDGQGRFFLALPKPGLFRLQVSRVGYATTRSQSFVVNRDDTVSVEFRVAPDAVLLDPITVTAHSLRGRNLFEEHRKDWGKGVFLAPQQIDSMQLRAPVDVFRGMENVRTTWGFGSLANGGRGPVPSVSSQMGVGCLLYMINRVFVRPTIWSGNEWTSYQLGNLPPGDIAAVEVYRSLGEVPPELRRFTHQFRPEAGVDIRNCGLVVYWTKGAW